MQGNVGCWGKNGSRSCRSRLLAKRPACVLEAHRPAWHWVLFLPRQIDRDILPLRVALEHAFEGELAADAALLVAAVGVTGALAETLVDLDPAGFERNKGGN